MAEQATDTRAAYWRKTLRITAVPQGALLVHLALIGIYAWFMNRLHGLVEDEGRG